MYHEYACLFKEQQLIINRMKNNIEKLEKIQRQIEEKNNDDNTSTSEYENENNSYLYSSDEEDESINFEESNISNNLRQALGLEEKTNFYNELSWTPPAKSGLNNSTPLINNNERK